MFKNFEKYYIGVYKMISTKLFEFFKMRMINYYNRLNLN